ncbi:MAG: SET domain-containing protein [Spirochaetales bacterium]|nr:SET domain-containing protein [Spirochaetales bacterium]
MNPEIHPGYIVSAKSIRTIPIEVRSSLIEGAGRGVFTLEAVPRGSFVGMDFSSADMLIAESDVTPESRYGCERRIEHICFDTRKREREGFDFLNHSLDPNLHFHLGYYFALRNIEKNEELTIDYRFLDSPQWGPDGDLVDETGDPLVGYEWRESLIRSCQTVLALLK